LVRDKHIDHLDVYAAALYLFLVTVADARGLSWYGDAQTARRLSMDSARLPQARGDLVRAGLLAYAGGLYQVLGLGDPLPKLEASVTRHDVAAGEASSRLTTSAISRAQVVNHLAALHAALGRPT
jgi:hypothetical protein